jgi:hypothetical protein
MGRSIVWLRVAYASESVWQLLNLCRARLQPCRKVRKIDAASAAGLFKIELPHGLFSLWGVNLLLHATKPHRLKPVLLRARFNSCANFTAIANSSTLRAPFAWPISPIASTTSWKISRISKSKYRTYRTRVPQRMYPLIHLRGRGLQAEWSRA